jgi:hypothetical protein
MKAVSESIHSHSPTLDTQLMVESCLREAGFFHSRRALMRALPRQVEYPTLAKTLEYLEASNKIHLAKDGPIVWVFVDNPKLLRLLRTSRAIKSAATPTSTDTSSGSTHRIVREKKTARMINNRNRRRVFLRPPS